MNRCDRWQSVSTASKPSEQNNEAIVLRLATAAGPGHISTTCHSCDSVTPPLDTVVAGSQNPKASQKSPIFQLLPTVGVATLASDRVPCGPLSASDCPQEHLSSLSSASSPH